MNFWGLLQIIDRMEKICERNLFAQTTTNLFFGVHSLAIVIQLQKYLFTWIQSASFCVVARVITAITEIYMNSNCRIQQICQLSNTVEKKKKEMDMNFPEKPYFLLS